MRSDGGGAGSTPRDRGSCPAAARRSRRTDILIEGGTQAPAALTDGFRLAFWAGIAFAVISLVTTLIALKREEVEAATGEPAPAPVA